MNSLSFAEARLRVITPRICSDYINAWRHDLDLFRERTVQLSSTHLPLQQIVDDMGLETFASYDVCVAIIFW